VAGTRTHQTVKLGRGRHASPADGACVMELASMLAGERFTDRPRCVDPLIAAYMRALNDRLPPRDRRRLLPFAAAAVNTNTGRRVRRERRRLCLDATSTPRRAARPLIALFIGITPAVFLDEGIGEHTARHFIANGDVDGALALLRRLLPSEAAPLALPVEDLAQLRVPGAGTPLVVEA
jgi:hypothetical protein